MLKWPVAGVATVVVVLGLALTGGPARAIASEASSNEVGVSSTTIKVAIVADVDNSIVPGVLQGLVDGVKGWAKYINANGGIAGRKVQVDFIDSKLNANAARNAIIKACADDFALVGTGALLLNTFDDELNCTDGTGKTTGLPDIASIVTNTTYACAPNVFPISPNSVDCTTIDRTPQTYRYNNGDSKYLSKNNSNSMHGSFVLAGDSPAVARASSVGRNGAQAAGIKSDHEWTVSGFAPQSEYTPIIQQMKADNSNYGLSLQAVPGVIAERQEAQLQGLNDPNIVWVCSIACYYDDSFVKAGDGVNGEYMAMSFLPFDEGSANPMTKNFVKYVGKDKLNGFASWGFTSGLLFQQAADAVVKKNGNDALTRANLLAELKTIHDFDGQGMVAKTDVGDKVPSSCFMLDRFRNGKFVRVYPTKKGTFDCKQSNLYTFQEDLNSK
jgi:ABC-type branched-subunit amino acid transport system substrate-binding protein